MSAHLSVRTSDDTRLLFDVMYGNMGSLTGCGADNSGADKSGGADCMRDRSQNRTMLLCSI